MLVFFENLFLCLIILSSFCVLLVTNPVQSLLWLILTFAFSSIIFMIFGVELMSIIIFMVYIGAIAVLFLFVIMMLNIKIIELRFFYWRYLLIGLFLLFFFIIEIYLSLIFELNYNKFSLNTYNYWILYLNFSHNLFLLGSIIFYFYFYLLIYLGLVLFISMLGSIILLIDWSNTDHLKKGVYLNITYFSNEPLILK